MSRVPQLTRFLAHACAAVTLLSALAAAQSSTPTFPGTSTVVPSTGDINSTLAKFNPFAPTAELTVSSVIGAVINIVIGILFVFFGIRLFKTVLFLGGALFGGYLAFAILTNAEPDGGYKVAISREAFYLIIILVAGLVCGFLALFLWRVGLVLLGAVGGFVLAVFLQGLRPGGLIPNQTGFWIMVAVFVIAGGIAAHFLENPLIISSTAISGSYSLFTGIDVFAKTGFAGLISGFINNGVSNAGYNLDWKLILMIVGFAVVALIGGLVQWFTHDRNAHGVASMRGGKAPHYGYAPVAHDPKVVVVR